MAATLHLSTSSIDQTLALGQLLGRLAAPNTFIALDGQLGAGKTHLTRGIALGAAVDDPTLVSSPTYVLLNIYSGPKPVCHLDAYRLQSAADLESMGLDELLTSSGIIVLEWAKKFPSGLPTDYLHIQIDLADDPTLDQRTFTFTAHGPRSAHLLAGVQQAGPAA